MLVTQHQIMTLMILSILHLISVLPTTLPSVEKEALSPLLIMSFYSNL